MKKIQNTYKPVSVLSVFYNKGNQKIMVGRLAHQRAQIWFEFDEAFLEYGLELSPIKLPLQSGLIPSKDRTFDGLFGLFNDSLPDGWGKLLLDRYLASLSIDYRGLSPLDRLAYVGNNGMGALSYEPDYGEAKFDKSGIDLSKISEEADRILEGETSHSLLELYKLGGSSNGARPKVLIGYNHSTNKIIHGQQDLPEGFEHWIVKFVVSNDAKDIGNIEYAYSLMARASGVEMPETRLFEGKDNKMWFGTKRFDRLSNSRVHMHSVSGLLHADYRYPSLDYDSLFRCSLLLNRDIKEVTKLFRLACFNVFAHNRDDHSKNFSFLMNSKGDWRGAPAYDLTFSTGPGGEHSTMVGGEGRNPSSNDLLKLAEKFYIKNAKSIIEEVKQSVSHWENFAKDAGVSKTSKDFIKKVIDKLIKT